jgi:hypothetical protein
MQLSLWLSHNRSDDYLLSKGQIIEAQELRDLGDISTSQKDAQDFLARSILKTDAYERRGRMLSKVTEIIWELSSTMEKGVLLNQILKNAITLFECDTGILFLTDDQTGDLEVSATHGLTDGKLLGRRFPSGYGFAGRAVLARTPIIENDMQHSEIRFEAEQYTEDTLHSLIAVPMQNKDHVFGVIEIANRRDNLYFLDDDKELLIAYANQATFALRDAESVRELSFTNTVASLGAWGAELSHDINRETGAIQRKLYLIKQKFPNLSPDIMSMLDDIEKYSDSLILPPLPKQPTKPGGMTENINATYLDNSVTSYLENMKSAYPMIDFIYELHCKDLRIATHERWLHTLLRHLVRNAIRSVENKDPKRVVIRTLDQGNYVRIEIEDTGAGIRPELLPFLFRQPIPHDNDNRKGQGLLIARFLVERNGGEIGIAWTHIGEGTCLYITLPTLP